MIRCPRCLHGELTDLKEPGPIIECDYCGYRDYSSNYRDYSLNIRKYNKFLLNARYKFGIIFKKKVICFALFLANLMYVLPMLALFIIIFIFVVVCVLESVTPTLIADPQILESVTPTLIADPQNKVTILVNYFITLEIYNILLTFFIMLGIVDLSILVLHRYVYKHIYNLILDLNKLAPGYFSDSREIIIRKEVDKPNESKLYPERLLIFGVVIILLDFAHKLLSDTTLDFTLDLKIILVGISMVLISIGIWKYLSFKADESDRNSE